MLVTVDFGSANTGATVYYQLLNTDKSVFTARTVSGVTEITAGTGTYGVNIADATLSGRTIVWDINGSAKTASESFSASGSGATPQQVWEYATRTLSTEPPTTAQIVAALELDGSKLDVLYDDWINNGRLDVILDAIKAKTDNLPVDPADESSIEAAISASTSPLATSAALAAVAGYIDNEITTIINYVDCLPASWVVPGTLTAPQVRTELATELARIDAAVSTRHAAGAAVAKSPATVDWATDVSNKPTIGTSTLTAPQVRTELATELARLDAAVSTRHAAGAAVAKSPATLDWSADVSNKPTIGTSTLDADGVRGAVGLAAANLDTQIGTLATAANLALLDALVDKMAPLLIGVVTGAGTGTEVYSYGGVTVTVYATEDGNVTQVTFA